MHQLIQRRFWFLGAMLALTAFFGWGISLIETEFSFDNFRTGTEGEAGFYEAYKDSFPYEDNAIQIALKGPEGSIWDVDFLQTVDSLFEAFPEIPYVDSVISPTRLEALRWTGLGVSRRPLLRFDAPKDLERSQRNLARDSLFYANFFSADRDYIAGLVLVDPEILDLDERDIISDSLDQLLESSGTEYIISGVPYIRTQYVRTIRGELASFVILSVGLTLIVMLILYRSFWGVAMPILVVGIGMVWNIGFMAVTGKPLDMLANLIPSIMFVVGIADTVHLVTRYQQDLASGLTGIPAMASTLKEIGASIFLTSLTTAIGFASLIVSPLAPIQKFGLYAAAGVMFAYIISIILAPTWLLGIKDDKIRKSRGFGNAPFWDRMLNQTYVWVKRKPWQIIAGTVVILLVSIYGIFNISYNTYLLDDISRDDPLYTSMRFFEEEFFGARPFEMAVMPKEDVELTDVELLKDIEAVQSYLQERERMSPFLSLVTYLQGVNRLTNGGKDKYYRIPDTQDEVDELMGYAYLTGAGEKLLSAVMTEGETMGRMSARMNDIGSYQFADLRADLDSFVVAETDTNLYAYHLTGSSIIVEENVLVLRNGLFQGLGVAFLLVAILMSLLFKDPRMFILGVIPNIIPLVITGGLMGFLGISLRASTSIVFLIAFGVAVDDTIHFLGRLRIEMREGRDIEEALKRTTVGTGKALILTSLILLSGFSMLLTSNFGGTFSVGLFTGLTLLIALFADLLLLPVLIRWGRIGKQKKGQNDT